MSSLNGILGLRTAVVCVTLVVTYAIWLMASFETDHVLSDIRNDTYTHAYSANTKTLNETRVKRLPGAICIGSKKSGTSMLAIFLALNPKIRVTGGEIHFFDQEHAYRQGYDAYLQRIHAVGPGEIAMEKTPKYFVYEPAAARIRAMNNSVKLLLILRDPVKRLISDYNHELSQPNNKSYTDVKEQRKYYRRIEKYYSFEELVFSPDGGLNLTYEPVIASMYDIHVLRYLALFPREQLLVLDGEAFNKDPLPTLRKCESFLGVPHLIRNDMFVFNEDKGLYCLAASGCATQKGEPHAAHSEEVLQKLQKFYTPHVRHLVELLGQQFEWSSKYL